MRRIFTLAPRLVGLLACLAALPACASEQSQSEARIDRMLDNACPHWTMTVVAPGRMEAWVEDIAVMDDRGLWVEPYGGMAGSLGQVEGWPALDRIGGGGSSIDNAGSPMEVSLRWQSLAEPQTYTWRFVIPESMRQAMAKKEPVFWLNKATMGCRSTITIGVAPGGHTVVWIGGNGTRTIEMMRGQADIEPLGPDQGMHEGRYVRIGDKAKQYVENHGIPYASWTPPANIPVVTNAQYRPAELPKVDIAAHPAGTYVLTGTMETNSAIRLRDDGTFEVGIEIGAAYGRITGQWTLNGNTIMLKTSSTSSASPRNSGADDLSPLFKNRSLKIDGRCLRTDMMGASACYLRQ